MTAPRVRMRSGAEGAERMTAPRGARTAGAEGAERMTAPAAHEGRS
jgi:hypothetical protein